MRCTSRKIAVFLAALMFVLQLTGCAGLNYSMEYCVDSDVSSFNVLAGNDKNAATPFAAQLCVVSGNILDEENVDMSTAGAAILCDLNNVNVICAKNVHEQMYPASLTKVMTALVALKYGSLDQKLTATSAVTITESGAQLCGLKSGDSMTLDQALRILLVYSANDVAMLIAENIAGSPEAFVDLMNEEAHRIGATNTHFANPHGLSQDEHYTTAYDLYLIMNEAIRYDTFNEIIQMTSYETTYYDKNGREKSFSKNTTNRFLRGDFKSPANVTVVGGKTGTTNAAGHCLMLYSRNVNGAPYISIILGADSSDNCYLDTIDLLDEINK